MGLGGFEDFGGLHGPAYPKPQSPIPRDMLQKCWCFALCGACGDVLG